MLSPSLRLRACSHESDVLPLPCREYPHARRLLLRRLPEGRREPEGGGDAVHCRQVTNLSPTL